MLNRKNTYYRDMLKELGPKDILTGVKEILAWLNSRQVPIAIGSSSKNTPLILDKIGLSSVFGAVVDGNQIKRSKPDPEVFLLAAERLGVSPADCLVVEDADAGVEAALAGGMTVLGVGSASSNEHAHYREEMMSIQTFTSLSIRNS